MNNDLIKKAYDSMTPDEAARQRMLSAVLAQSGEASGGKYCSYAAPAPKAFAKPAYAVIAAMLLLVTGILAGPSLWNAYAAWNAANEATEPVNYEDPTSETENANSAESVGADDSEIIEKTAYYVIAEKDGLYRYIIYDTAGNIALSCDSLTIMPQITVIENRLVRIATQAGTGIATNSVQYYDLERNMISQVYQSVFSECGNLVAWANHEKVIVRDIFDDNGFYQELAIFNEPFSQVAFPFVSVAFTEDGSHVSVTYLSGPDYTEVSEVFEIKGAEDTSAVPVTVTPLPVIMEVNGLDNCTAAISVKPKDIWQEDTGAVFMNVMIYCYDLYDMVDIAKLKVGDCLYIRWQTLEIISLVRAGNGDVLINGGHDAGGCTLRTDEDGVYYEVGPNGEHIWQEYATTTIPVSPDFRFCDSDGGCTLVYTTETFLEMEFDGEFTPYNTTIVIENGCVVAMERTCNSNVTGHHDEAHHDEQHHDH